MHTMQTVQYALPFSTPTGQPRTMNNRGMVRNPLVDIDGATLEVGSVGGERVRTTRTSGELTRTSDRKRGTFDAKPAAARSRTPKPQTPAEAAQKMRNKALRLLTTREHSREELLRKLAQAKARNARLNAVATLDDVAHETTQTSKDDIESLVDQLATQGWQSDDRYAEALVRRLTGQASKRFIAEKLAQAGIKKDAAQLAVEAIEDEDRDVALALWTRRFGDVPSDEKDRQRQIRFLLSRGFHLSDAFKIVPKPVRIENNVDKRHNKWRKH